MEKQHLTYFKIENFKRFDSFEMSNLGQFNLIVGDNNVGKTTVLEALTLETNHIKLVVKLILNFCLKNDMFEGQIDEIFEKNSSQKQLWIHILKNINKRLILSHEYYDKSKTDIAIEFVENNQLNRKDINSISKQIPRKKQPELWTRYYSQEKYKGTFGVYNSESVEIMNSNDVNSPNILRMNVGYNDNHIDVYYQDINPHKDRRVLLDEGIRFILKNLEEIRPHKILDKEVLGIVLKNDEKIYPITQFGDGLIKIMRITLGIISCQKSRIMIDEIEAGIHFSKIKGFWKTIIQLCSNYNVQLFATTHSLECQQAFVEALEDPEMIEYQKDARNISLIENKQGEVKAVTYDFGQFEYALNIGFNTRGGAR